MKVVRDFYIFIAIIVFMIMRIINPGWWFSSTAIVGFLVSWIDTIEKVRKSNLEFKNNKAKENFAITMLVMCLVGAVLLVLMLVNIIKPIGFMNQSLFIDEVTLLALLLCLLQDVIVNLINNIIKK